VVKIIFSVNLSAKRNACLYEMNHSCKQFVQKHGTKPLR